MATIAATGASTLTETEAAISQAARIAVGHLKGRPPTYGFIFGSHKHDLARAVAVARQVTRCNDIIAASTAGEFTERGATLGGVSLMLVSSDDSVHRVAPLTIIGGDPNKAAKNLCEGLSTLTSEATAQGAQHPTTVLMGNGLSSELEGIVSEFRRFTRPHHQLVGGAAADNWELKQTHVAANDAALIDGAVALHVFSKIPWGVGVQHGLRPVSTKMRITNSDRRTVRQIDGKPAFEVYREYARKHGKELTDETLTEFLFNNAMGLYFFENMCKVRAAMTVNRDGSLSCGGEVPKDAYVSFLEGNEETLLSSGREAALEAQRALDGAKAAGVLVFDCVTRGKKLGSSMRKEIENVRAVFPDAPVAGFLCYGEVGRGRGRLEGWHNETIVVAAIPA